MSEEYKRLYRARDERMAFGVCGGVAKYFGVDPTLIRLLFVLLAVAGHGSGLLAYIVLSIIVPEEPAEYAAPCANSAGSQPSVEVEPNSVD